MDACIGTGASKTLFTTFISLNDQSNDYYIMTFLEKKKQDTDSIFDRPFFSLVPKLYKNNYEVVYTTAYFQEHLFFSVYFFNEGLNTCLILLCFRFSEKVF